MARKAPSRWAALDGLRAVAVVLVIGYHADGVVRSGYLGVDVFFVLSGFLITTLLMREDRTTGSIHLGQFYLRRALRLYPALVAVCLAVTMAAVVLGQHAREVALGALTSVFYVANIWEYLPGHNTYLLQHTWTLALESQFYLLWPVLFVLVVRRWWGGWLIGAAWIGLELTDLFVPSAVLHTYIRGAGLPLGCLLAFAVRNAQVRRVLSSLGGPALVGIVVLACLPDVGALATGWPISLGAVLAAPVIVALTEPTRLARVGAHPALVWVGARSYGLYLWHFPILSVLINQAPQQIPLALRLIIGVVLSFVVAALSYRWVELPFLRRKQAHRPTRSADTADGTPSTLPS